MAAPRSQPFAPETVAALRRALLTGESDAAVASREPELGELERQVTRAWQLRQNARYIDLGVLLPILIVQCEAARREFGGDD